MRKLQMTMKITAVGFGVVLVFVGWWLLKPLFIDKEINEALPMTSQIEQGTEKTADKGKETGEMENKTPTMPVADKETVKLTAAVFEGAFVDGEPGHHAKGKVVTLVNGDTTILVEICMQQMGRICTYSWRSLEVKQVKALTLGS